MTVTQEQFGSVREDIRTLGDTVLELKETAADHTYRLTMLRTRLENLDMRFNKVERRLEGMDGRLDGLQGSVNEILTLVRKSQ